MIASPISDTNDLRLLPKKDKECYFEEKYSSNFCFKNATST